jgi:fucose permease
MNHTITIELITPGRIQQVSTRIAFFIAGIAMAAWAPLVPFAKARAQIEDGMLGLLLLCLGIGSIIAMPVAGALTAKLGCRGVITASTLILSLALPFLATLSSVPGLIVSLFVFGAGVGALDVGMNVQAVIVERGSGTRMMSGFHGLFSLGGMFGAAGVAMLLGAGVTPLVAVMGVLILIAIALVVSGPALLMEAGVKVLSSRYRMESFS